MSLIQNAFNTIEKDLDSEHSETLHDTDTLERVMETWMDAVQMDGSGEEGSGGEGSGDPGVTTIAPGNMWT